MPDLAFLSRIHLNELPVLPQLSELPCADNVINEMSHFVLVVPFIKKKSLCYNPACRGKEKQHNNPEVKGSVIYWNLNWANKPSF